jgi:putative ABC transport system permease protein
VAYGPPWLAEFPSHALNTRVLLFTIGLSLVTGLAFGVVPAVQVSRADLMRALRESARSASPGPAHQRMQQVLVGVQIALTLVLLVGAGLLIRSFVRLQQADRGFEPGGVLTFQSRLPANQYFRQVGSVNGVTQLDVSPIPAMLFTRAHERLAQVPGVTAVAGINRLPLMNAFALQVPLTVHGQSEVNAAGQSNALMAGYWMVTPHVFETLQIPIRHGRDLTAQDQATAPKVAVVNETAARQFWPDANPVGQQLTVNIMPGEPPREVVGVVADARFGPLDRASSPALFVPHAQEPLRYRTPFGQDRVQMTFLLRVTQPLDVVVPAIRRAIAEVDKSLPVSDIAMLEDAMGQQTAVQRGSMALVTSFGLVALLLATCGIYGMVAYAVAQRSREIGIRLALGASARHVISLVLGQTVLVIAGGLLLGLLGSMSVTRLLTSVLWEITPTDPGTFAGVALLLAVIAVAATLAPTRRAVRLDPKTILSEE